VPRFDSPAARVRSVCLLEGVSYLLLLFVAMPLKYFVGMPLAVRIVGSLHGILFVWLAVLVLSGLTNRQRSFSWALRIMVASLLPFGAFVIDGRLKADVGRQSLSSSRNAGGGK
jgi:integral membrane protein